MHTHKKPSNMSMFLHKAPSIKSTLSPPLFHQKNATENSISVITMVIFPDICVFRFSILVSVDPQQCRWVWFTSKHGVAHNPMLHFWQLELCFLSLCLAETAWHQILLNCISQCLLSLVSSLYSWLVDEASSQMLSGEGSLLTLYWLWFFVTNWDPL